MIPNAKPSVTLADEMEEELASLQEEKGATQDLQRERERQGVRDTANHVKQDRCDVEELPSQLDNISKESQEGDPLRGKTYTHLRCGVEADMVSARRRTDVHKIQTHVLYGMPLSDMRHLMTEHGREKLVLLDELD